MLSWSGKAHGIAVGLASMKVDVDHADALLEFALAAPSPASELDSLVVRRQHLVDLLGVDAMVDAAAIVANFEMMTRLAEGTGAVLHNMASVRAGTAVGADVFKHHD